MTEGALATVEPGAFDGLTGLQGLLLDGNRLASWPAGALRGPSALAALSLARNGIRAVPGSAFADQPGLSFLNLAGNAISVWPKSALEMLTSLGGPGPEAATTWRSCRATPLPVSSALSNASTCAATPVLPFVLGLQLDRAGSGALSEGDQARVLAKTASGRAGLFRHSVGLDGRGRCRGAGEGPGEHGRGRARDRCLDFVRGQQRRCRGCDSGRHCGCRVRIGQHLRLGVAARRTRWFWNSPPIRRAPTGRPVITDSIPPVSLAPGEAGEPDTATVNVSAYFSDPDGDSLVYEAVPARRIVAASIEGDSLTLVSLLPGRTSVEVRAFDPDGFVAVLDLAVTVRGAVRHGSSVRRRHQRRAQGNLRGRGRGDGSPSLSRAFRTSTFPSPPTMPANVPEGQPAIAGHHRRRAHIRRGPPHRRGEKHFGAGRPLRVADRRLSASAWRDGVRRGRHPLLGRTSPGA